MKTGFSIVNAVYPFSRSEAPQKLLDGGKGSARLVFAALADPQVSNYLMKRVTVFDAVCEDLANAGEKLDAVVIAGDIAENGLRCEYDYVAEKLQKANAGYFLPCVGNHDIRLTPHGKTVRVFTEFINRLNSAAGNSLKANTLYYKQVINGCTFLILGSDKTVFEESYFSKNQLNWLDSELTQADKKGTPSFVICHQPLKNNHGLPGTWNSPGNNAGSVGAQSDELRGIMNRHRNVFYLTGHLHVGYGKFTLENSENFTGVTLPTATLLNKNGDCSDKGLGYVVEVFEDKVVFNARNFAMGINMPEYNFEVSLNGCTSQS